MSAAPFPLAYCLNVHRVDTLDDVLRAMHEPPNINRIRFPIATAICILAALACQVFLPAAARATDAAYAPVSSRFKPRPLPAHADPLGDLFGGDLLDSEGQPADPADLEGKFIGLYFSASWCPPCRAFTPRLVEFADRLRAEGKPFALVLVGCDENRDAALEYMKSHDMTGWLVPPESDARKRLGRLLHVEYIPKLVILDPGTRIIDFDGRTTVQEAPDDAWSRWTR